VSTVLFSINPGDTYENITIASGPAITTKNIELNVDLGNDVTDGNSSTNPRPIKKSEVIEALEKIMQAVLHDVTFLID
jgi:hypothetical protein